MDDYLTEMENSLTENFGGMKLPEAAMHIQKQRVHIREEVIPSWLYTVPEEFKAAGFGIGADEAGLIIERHNSEDLKYLGGVNGLAKKLKTCTTNGLATEDTELNRRRQLFGTHDFTEHKRPKFVWDAVHDIFSPGWNGDMTLMVIAVTAFYSLFLGIATQGWREGALACLGFLVCILLVVFVAAISYHRQSLHIWDLEKEEKKKISVQVTRNGYRHKLSIYDLLPGDIVHVAIGDQVPADGLFLYGHALSIDESSLTGVPEPVKVNPENPYLLSGTKVVDGSCKMLVMTVGMRTQWGKLMLKRGTNYKTPLQVKTNIFPTISVKIGLFLLIVLFAGSMQGLINSKMMERTRLTWFCYFNALRLGLFGIALVITELLPLAFTFILAFVMKKLMNDKLLVCNLAACETMGSATTICIDKIGMLTTNHMSVVKSCICMNVKDRSKQDHTSDIPTSALKLLLQSIFTNTGGEFVSNERVNMRFLGHQPTPQYWSLACPLVETYNPNASQPKF